MDKEHIRRRAFELRRAETDRQGKSLAICDRLFELDEFRSSQVVLFYANTGTEVETTNHIAKARSLGKQIALPYCVGNEIRLADVQGLEDLEPGAFDILEPRHEIRRDETISRDAASIDLVLVPGVAFDMRGGRLGRGQGYYDRFLSRMGDSSLRIALAFECQIFDQIPMSAHDMYVDVIVTERKIFRCQALREGRG